MPLPAFIVHCPELGRDLSAITSHVPHAVPIATPRTPEGSHDGAIYGHQEAVRRAEAMGSEAVLVLEDDCQFLPAFSLERMAEDVAWAGAHGYTVVNGGCVSAANPRKVRDGLVAVDRFKSAHCIVYLRGAYRVVKRLVFPMDPMIGRLGGKCLVAHPFWAIQRPIFSGTLNRFTDNRARYAACEQLLWKAP